ncbi:MAG: TolC family protein [Gammaproteobacteria bacterium]|nr:TolC family protein [Gammaproteobacteria bacterium]MBQ0840557.1 TolC family protein [Gammaproteobacteria bacterium]
MTHTAARNSRLTTMAFVLPAKTAVKAFSLKPRSLKPLLCTASLLFTTSLFCLPASAESLSEAWQLALSKNKQIEAAKQNQLAAHKKIDTAKAARLPNLVVSAEYLHLDNAPTLQGNSLAALPGAPAGQGMVSVPFEMQIAEDNAMLYTAIATLPIYTSGRISSAIDAAKAQASASIDKQQQTTLDIKLAVAEAYIQVLKIAELNTIASGHIAALTGHQKDVSNLHQQGLVSRNDLLMASVALSNAQQQSISVNNQLAVASARYNQLLNRPLNTAVNLEPLTLHSGELGDVQALTTRALTSRPELSALNNNIDALNFNAKSLRAATLPQVSLNGSYLSLDNDLLVDDEVIAYGVNLTWPIFDGGITRHRGSELRFQAAALQAQLDDYHDIIQLQVTQAWLNLSETQQRIKALGHVLEQSAENLTMTQNRYREGLVSSSQVLEAQSLRLQSLGNHTSATYDSALAWIRLQRMTGEL